ncbi:MAG: membrane protein insertase YidC [Bacteroidetes bacterium]|nr:membrane protein insertase YidC [Bacteroidota bacterium]
MNFDRNTVLGFVLLIVLFFGYFYYTNMEQVAFNKAKARQQFIQDSIAKANSPVVDTLATATAVAKTDSVLRSTAAGYFVTAAQGVEELQVVENQRMKVVFTNKGGQIKSVTVKEHTQFGDTMPVTLATTSFARFGYAINTALNRTASTAALFYAFQGIEKKSDGSQVITFELAAADTAYAGRIRHQYTIYPADYRINLQLEFDSPAQLFTQGQVPFLWQYEALKQESDIAYEKQNTQVGFVEDGAFDYFTIGNRSTVDFTKPVGWVGVRQRFFFAAIEAPSNFTSGQLNWILPPDSTGSVIKATAALKMQLPASERATVGLKFYFGPADYTVLKKYDNEFEKIVNLGQGAYTFVRPLNKYVIVPIFDFLKNISLGNIGLAIALLTLFIRVLTSPLIYSSYLSGAKMKALRPEIAKLKEKYGEDQQTISMEQMKLFREAGVNPLGGCIPALLQIPIFFALFSFFNAEIALRGASFLWANDLSAYDAPIRFGFTIPLFGDHLSLFNFLATATSLLISVYSMSLSPDQSNPMMKYMPYIFPVFMLFFFNSLPAALTWYYTVSNLITLVLQFVIQNYIIDHDKILLQIQENRKKPKPKSMWQEKLEQMQAQQKKLKDMQDKSKR